VTREIDSDPNRFAVDLFDGLPAHYDMLANILSFGQDRRWRREVVKHVADTDSPGLVLDVATGPAGIALAIRGATGARVVGIDITKAMLARAHQNLSRRGENSIHLIQGRAEQLPFPDQTFDAVSFSYLLRYVADPAATLTELSRVLRPGGTLASLEFHVPPALWWHASWWLYTRLILPTAGWLIGGSEWFNVGRFLGPNISQHYRKYSVAWTVDAWKRAGIDAVETRLMSLGGGLVMWGTKGYGTRAR